MRILIKAIGWRVLGTLTTFVVASVTTHSYDVAIKVSCVEFLAKIAMYYGYEYLWENKIE